MKKIDALFLVVLFFFLSISGGCSPSGNLSGLVPAQGTVLYKGEPVVGALITFLPDKAAEGYEQRSATALTTDAGEFMMMTLQPKDGVFPGTYKVTISKNVPEKVYTNEELQEFLRKKQPTPTPKVKNHLPENYASSKQTPLTITLDKKGDKAIRFELSD